MALLGNYSVLCKLPGTFMAGSTTSVESKVRSNFNNSGSQRNFLYPDGATTSLHLVGEPTGYYPPYTWLIPTTSGDMSTGYVNAGGAASVTLNLAGGYYISTAIVGAATLNPPIAAIGNIAYSDTGAASVTATMSALSIIFANLAGSGDVSGSITGGAGLVLNTSGAATMSASMNGALSAVSAIVGSGDLSGAMAGALLALANITGAATVNAPILGLWNMSASPSGSGTFLAAIVADGWIAGYISDPSGTVTATVGGSPGDMSASIQSFSTLSPENLALAVWNQFLESGYTAEDLMRLMSAAMLGKVSGASGTSVAFRDVNDTTDRITATVDSSGDRISVTLNPN